MKSISRAVTLGQRGGGGIFFAYTPDMQYFKGRLPPTFSVPLKHQSKELYIFTDCVYLLRYPMYLKVKYTKGECSNIILASHQCCIL